MTSPIQIPTYTLLIVFLFIYCFTHFAQSLRSSKFSPIDFCSDPDCDKNVTQLITYKGYPCEDHSVTTSDGYILSLQRIPHGKYGYLGTRASRPVVFLQHGLLDSSATWVINLPNESLGFILADAGFDVWLGNSRGNTYSHSHKTLSTTSEQYWDFNWDQMGQYDLPAFINFILSSTGQSSLYYIGHSQGTEIGFAYFNTADWAKKIRLFVALAPVAYLTHCSSELLVKAAETNLAYEIQDEGHYEVLASSQQMEDFLDAACDQNPEFCGLTMCAICGCDPKNINESRYDVLFQHFPAGTSTLDFCHYTQQIEVANFTKYDYLSASENKAHYGTSSPPQYYLSSVSVPVALISGGRDKLADPTDVSRLASELPKSKIVYQNQISYYSHVDFVWGMDAKDVLYPTIIKLLNTY